MTPKPGSLYKERWNREGEGESGPEKLWIPQYIGKNRHLWYHACVLAPGRLDEKEAIQRSPV